MLGDGMMSQPRAGHQSPLGMDGELAWPDATLQGGRAGDGSWSTGCKASSFAHQGGAASSREEPNAPQDPLNGDREGPQAAGSQPQKATSWTCCEGGRLSRTKGPFLDLPNWGSCKRRKRGARTQLHHTSRVSAHAGTGPHGVAETLPEDFVTEISGGLDDRRFHSNV